MVQLRTDTETSRSRYSETRRYYRGEKDKDNIGVSFGFRLDVFNDRLQRVSKETPVIADVAPSVIHIMGLQQPKEMTGKCLIGPKDQGF